LSSKIYIGQSYFFNHVNLSVRWQKVALMALRRVGMCMGQSQIPPSRYKLCRLRVSKEFQNFYAVGKKIKTQKGRQ
jgi:hypothetical protein